jgi:arylsulfatase A-like enzyme
MRLSSVLIAAVCLGLVGAAFAGPAYGQGVAEEPPNIVLIMADDLGYGDLGSYGQTQIETPHLDQMAREGIRFTQFYAGSTVCAPSRSVLMTGQHAGHTPVRGNMRPGGIGNAPLPDESVTVAEMLGEAGYVTGGFGKWGLGGPSSTGLPTKQGFDTFYGYLDQLRAHFYYPEFLYSDGERVPLEGNEVVDDPPIEGAGHPVERGTYSHDAIMRRALSFVERNGGQESPFFLYLPVTIPHAALTVPDSARVPYLNENGESIFAEDPFEGGHYPAQPMPYATYAAMVTRLDRDVGRLLDKLRALGLTENTIVFFTSDNGPHDAGGYDPSVLDSNGPLRAGKGTLYEGGIRVPMIAWAPGRFPAGATAPHISYFGDVMATLADIAGTDPPTPHDGLSFLPTLRGHPERQQQHSALYWEYYGGNPLQAVRLGKWKALRRPGSGTIELYNLQRDLSERQNVAVEHPDLIERIERIMAREHTPAAHWKLPSAEK